MRAAVLASGSGSNFQALVDRQEDFGSYRVALLVTDRSCGAEARADTHRIARSRIDFGTPSEEVGDGILALLNRHRIEGVLLAGFLRLLPYSLCRAFGKRILNIHPALLPSFGGRGMYGLHVHEAVLRSGAALSGPTVHFVDERYDEGTILAQWPVPVCAGDSPTDLAERVLAIEHQLYPAAADALARALARGWPEQGRGPSFRWPGDRAADADDRRNRAISGAFADDP